MTGLFIALTSFMMSLTFSGEVLETNKYEILKTVNMMNNISTGMVENCIFGKTIGLNDNYIVFNAECRLKNSLQRYNAVFGVDYKNKVRKKIRLAN